MPAEAVVSGLDVVFDRVPTEARHDRDAGTAHVPERELA
jgi:hypothetical protein